MSDGSALRVLYDSEPDSLKRRNNIDVLFKGTTIQPTIEDTMSDDNKSGRKYFRPIKGAKEFSNGDGSVTAKVDVYAVAETFGVTCPARTHALKKILLAGDRGKNDTIADLDEARDAITRAIELEEQREAGR
jgi:hypothetical protein